MSVRNREKVCWSVSWAFSQRCDVIATDSTAEENSDSWFWRMNIRWSFDVIYHQAQHWLTHTHTSLLWISHSSCSHSGLIAPSIASSMPFVCCLSFHDFVSLSITNADETAPTAVSAMKLRTTTKSHVLIACDSVLFYVSFTAHVDKQRYGSCPSVCLSVHFVRVPTNSKPRLVQTLPRAGVSGVSIIIVSSKCQRSGGRPHTMSAQGRYSWV